MYELLSKLPYITSAIMACIGLYMSIVNDNLLNRLFGLGFLQSGILLFFIAFAKVIGGAPPVYSDHKVIMSNPVPHVLMLTAIVVGVAILAVGLAIIYRLYKAHGTISYSKLVNKI